MARVVGADEGDEVARHAVDEADKRDAGGAGLGDRPCQRAVVGGGEDDGVGPLGMTARSRAVWRTGSSGVSGKCRVATAPAAAAARSTPSRKA